MTVRVYVEVGAKRVFASALDWPGWSRSGKSEDLAVEALGAYRPRYETVVRRAGRTLAKGDFEVVEHVEGNVSTDFGVPEKPSRVDTEPLKRAEAAKLAELVQASWDELETIYKVTPEQLLKGPRGGGRDREKMYAHVIGAEAGYSRRLGLKPKQPDNSDTAAIAAMRADLIAVLRKPSDGSPPAGGKGWTQRYAARRIAWHVLDHAWEMQDKTP
jgi:hypothetical protein